MYYEFINEGEVDYLKITNPDDDLERLKKQHIDMLGDPLYRH